MMKKLLSIFLLITSLNLIGQVKKDSIPVKLDSVAVPEDDLFSDLDLAMIDSLVLQSKYNSPLLNNLPFVNYTIFIRSILTTWPSMLLVFITHLINLRYLNLIIPYSVLSNLQSKDRVFIVGNLNIDSINSTCFEVNKTDELFANSRSFD